MLAPDVKRISIEGRTIRISGEFDNLERIVHMDVASHDGAEPSAQGHSIGRFAFEPTQTEKLLGRRENST